MKLVLSQKLYEEIKAHALDELPRECCGVVATQITSWPGRDDTHYGKKIFRATNASTDPKLSYKVDPEDQLWITEEIERAGLKLGAIYHSHPNDSVYPSSGDSQFAYPAIHLVIGMGGRLSMCAWRFDLGLAHQVELEIAECG